MVRTFMLWPVLGATLLLSACAGSAPTAALDDSPLRPSQLGLAQAPAPLGIYRLAGDPATGVLDFSRIDHPAQALGDSYAVDLTLLSTTTLRFTGLILPQPDLLRLQMSWSHPLPDTSKRIDLSIFDLRMHLLTNDVGTSFAGPGGMNAPTGAGGASEALVTAGIDLRNADGWSTWGDEVVEPATGTLAPNCYPFVLVHEDNGRAPINPAAPAGWNVLPQSSTVYPFDLDLGLTVGNTIDIFVAVDVSYGASALRSIANPGVGARLNPRYLNPEFNVKEGWKASASASGPIEAGNAGDLVDLAVTLFDHQGSLTASGAFDPLTAPSTSLRYASGFASCEVSIPGAMPVAITLAGGIFNGDGTPATPYNTLIAIHGDDITGAQGNYVGVVAFIDGMRASASQTTPVPTSGFDRASQLVKRYDFATYATFTLTVEPFVPPPGTWTQLQSIIENGDPGTGATSCMACHSFGSGGLTLTNDSAANYANLVGVPSFSCPPLTRVVAGSSATSFLYEKISQTTPTCGLQMPRNGPPYLSPANIALVQTWINSGAPFN